MKKIRVLYLISGTMHYGGTEAFIMNYYRHIDHDKIQFDFVYQGKEKGVYDDELTLYGSKIYRVQNKSKHPLQYSKQIKELLIREKYKIVHSHMDAMGAWPLIIAKQVGVTNRIAHSHNTSHQTNNYIKKMWNDVAKILLRKASTHYFACGQDAGAFMFGNKLMKLGQIELIHNGIDLEKYSYSEKDRRMIRDEFGLNNEFVVGHVGQFREQKNHKKILEIFDKILKKHSDAKLFLVGEGPLKKDIIKEVRKAGLIDHVIFAGERNDVCNVLSAFDVFIFPSLFEGLSIVAIEAQANGLPCVFSEKIPLETAVTELVIRKNLTDSSESWCKAVLLAYNNGRKDCIKDLIAAGYDINLEAGRLQEKYLKMAGEML